MIVNLIINMLYASFNIHTYYNIIYIQLSYYMYYLRSKIIKAKYMLPLIYIYIWVYVLSAKKIKFQFKTNQQDRIREARFGIFKHNLNNHEYSELFCTAQNSWAFSRSPQKYYIIYYITPYIYTYMCMRKNFTIFHLNYDHW